MHKCYDFLHILLFLYKRVNFVTDICSAVPRTIRRQIYICRANYDSAREISVSIVSIRVYFQDFLRISVHIYQDCPCLLCLSASIFMTSVSIFMLLVLIVSIFFHFLCLSVTISCLIWCKIQLFCAAYGLALNIFVSIVSIVSIFGCPCLFFIIFN